MCLTRLPEGVNSTIPRNALRKNASGVAMRMKILRTQNNLFRSVRPGDSTLRLVRVAIMRVTLCIHIYSTHAVYLRNTRGGRHSSIHSLTKQYTLFRQFAYNCNHSALVIYINYVYAQGTQFL